MAMTQMQIIQSLGEAMSWLERELGWGVPPNNVTAYTWVNISAAQGRKQAVDGREIIEKKMTPDELARRQTLSKVDWAKYVLLNQ